MVPRKRRGRRKPAAKKKSGKRGPKSPFDGGPIGGVASAFEDRPRKAELEENDDDETIFGGPHVKDPDD